MPFFSDNYVINRKWALFLYTNDPTKIDFTSKNDGSISVKNDIQISLEDVYIHTIDYANLY